jgi:hypothetical protein
MPNPVLNAITLEIGGHYNWKNREERLVYVGMCEPRNGRWHQFRKVDEPGKIWCEVMASDLHMMEETPQEPGAMATDEEISRILSPEAIKTREMLKLALDGRAKHPYFVAMRHLARRAVDHVYVSEVKKGVIPYVAAYEAAVWFGREEVQNFGY